MIEERCLTWVSLEGNVKSCGLNKGHKGQHETYTVATTWVQPNQYKKVPITIHWSNDD